MNILQKEIEMKCIQHPELPILFINMQQNLDTQDQSIYLCEMCLSENMTFSPTQILSIRQIIEDGEKQIIQKWPPLNNYQILQDLILKIKEIQDKKSIESKMMSFFAELKEEILQQIDFYQKKIMNYVSGHSQIFEQYQKISKIDQLRDILIESKQNPQSKIEDLKRLLVELQQEKEKNTTLLYEILNRSSLLDDKFKQENLNSFKSYALSFFNKLDIFCVENLQDIDQHQINLKDNQKNIQQLMKLISNKSNYCSDEFLKTINEQLTKIEPFIVQLKFDKVTEKQPIQFDMLENEDFELINKQVDHMIKLKKNNEYNDEILNSQLIQLILKCQNNLPKTSEIYQQFRSYMVSTYPFAINFIQYDQLYKQIEICFNEEQKSPNLRLKSNTIIVCDQNTDNRFGFVKPPIDKQKISRIQFKVLQIKSWVGLGICYAKTIQNKSYQFQSDQIGNGYYIISNNGYSWSHSHKDQHKIQKSFNFTKDQIIYIEFNPIKKQLKFYNKSINAKYNMDIEIAQNDEIVFCVALHHNGDEVEILNNQETLNTIEFD
ncbi:hypothetical protein ABPG74_020140 [Tetrahymena malaccensis]